MVSLTSLCAFSELARTHSLIVTVLHLNLGRYFNVPIPDQNAVTPLWQRGLKSDSTLYHLLFTYLYLLLMCKGSLHFTYH